MKKFGALLETAAAPVNAAVNNQKPIASKTTIGFVRGGNCCTRHLVPNRFKNQAIVRPALSFLYLACGLDFQTYDQNEFHRAPNEKASAPESCRPPLAAPKSD
jgi:hypothetical protein